MVYGKTVNRVSAVSNEYSAFFYVLAAAEGCKRCLQLGRDYYISYFAFVVYLNFPFNNLSFANFCTKIR